MYYVNYLSGFYEDQTFIDTEVKINGEYIRSSLSSYFKPDNSTVMNFCDERLIEKYPQYKDNIYSVELFSYYSPDETPPDKQMLSRIIIPKQNAHLYNIEIVEDYFD